MGKGDKEVLIKEKSKKEIKEKGGREKGRIRKREKCKWGNKQ